MEKLKNILDGPKVQVAASSGMLSVTVHPRPHLVVGLATLGVDLFFASFLFYRWQSFPILMRVIWIWVLVSGTAALLYQFSGEEVIEFDARKLTIRKGIHGWERTREYDIDACSELEWERGRKGSPSSLKCKVGWRSIRFGHYVSEANANQILCSLQQALPEVARRICAHRDGKEHFITLGLNGN